MANRRGGALVKERGGGRERGATRERGRRERGGMRERGARTRARPTWQDYGEQAAESFQRLGSTAPGRRRTRTGRRTRPAGWGNAAVAAAAALAGVLIGAATARRGR